MVTRFPMVVLGLRRPYVELDDAELQVRAGWAFRLQVPRSAVAAVGPDRGRVLGWGVHGWRGEWLLNGSSQGIVRISLDPSARARVLGWPVRVRVLRVQVEDPQALMAGLAA